MQARLSGETDLAGFRAQARLLLAQGIDPSLVHWTKGHPAVDLFAGEDAPAVGSGAAAPHVSVPATFLTLCETVVLHADPQRFALLYRLQAPCARARVAA